MTHDVADTPAVRIQGLSKRFGSVQALSDVTFDIAPRSVFGLLGPNGAGKTTLFSLAANFLKPDGGRIEVLGIDVNRISRLQGRLTILPQDALFQRNVPILEQLAFFRLLDGKSREDAEAEVKSTLERVGLGEYMNRRVHALSHGMIKRLGIAQAFLGEPEVILLDEPTSGLDPKNARQIRDLVRELHSRATVVVSSHNLAEIQELCDHVAILDNGKVVTAGSVAEITGASKELDLRLARPLDESARRSLEALDVVISLRDNGGGRYTVSIDLSRLPADEAVSDAARERVLRHLLDGGNVPVEFREGSTLEEHFLKVTGSGNGQD